MERVERMEELFLQSFFAFHELNVVDEQHINFAVTTLEGSNGVATNAIDIFVQERFGRDIANFVMGVVLVNVIPNGMQQVGFAKSGRTINKQRVV